MVATMRFTTSGATSVESAGSAAAVGFAAGRKPGWGVVRASAGATPLSNAAMITAITSAVHMTSFAAIDLPVIGLAIGPATVVPSQAFHTRLIPISRRALSA